MRPGAAGSSDAPTAAIPVVPPVPSGSRPAPRGTRVIDPSTRTSYTVLIIAVAVGTLVSVGLGVYGRVHEPSFYAINLAGFSSGTAVKAWLGTAAFALALVQIGSAVLMYRGGPAWTSAVHRWSGRLAVLVTVPVVVHCLYALGFDPSSPRVLAHSLAGCFFYGVFAAKMLVLARGARSPRWSVPLLGGLLFTALTTLWLTSSLWFFTTTGLTF